MDSGGEGRTVEIRTRFAPSPTGYLHIGGVRTALFNWLFARRHGGQFILRIDDTDRERNVAEALEPILDGFRWLGIDWDEGPEVGGRCAPYFQSERGDRHRAAVDALLACGCAYRDYATADETAAEREAAQRAKQRFIYSRRWMAETDADAARFESEGRTAVVRLKMPREGACAFDDLVRGPVAFDWALEQDHVIQRADGTPLYHLASAVDDHDFDITHVIRAEEHLSNTPRQIFIMQSLGYDLPRYAHVPYVAAPGGSEKLSKRKLGKYLKQDDFRKAYEHAAGIMAALGETTDDDAFNPVMVRFYRSVGYLPDALLNYLLLVGWSLDDHTEDFSRDAMIANFSLERVNKSAASFDPQKLLAFQERRMARLPLDEKVELVRPYLAAALGAQAGASAGPPASTPAHGPPGDPPASRPAPGPPASTPAPADPGKLGAVVTAAADRLKVAGDIVNYTEFFVADDAFPYDAKAFGKRVGAPGAAGRLGRFRSALADVDPFDAATVEAALHRFVESEGVRIGAIIHAVRVGVTGKPVGFGLFDAMAILGRDVCLARIDRALTAATAANLAATRPAATNPGSP
ncbi:MAG: glutamate--tRNA ligase [Acidobacteria bacterium]|nr:glutamate--tRNA ligase [Acidobacteriota bacterium]MYJ04797.1 glutamate--tRNA ligase [Acidobacteriota bacterium]